MKAAVLKAFGLPLSVETVPDPVPGTGEVIVDVAATTLALAGISMPNFWLGPLLAIVFAVTLGWLPVSGSGTLAHLVLPAITLGAPLGAVLARMTRASVLEELRELYVLAARDAYMTLPARKEGIIPGAANLRLARFVGARLARQAVLAERRLDCASPEGRLICDEIVPDMDGAISRTVERLTGSGVVSAAGNRRAFRIGEEPLDSFRRYMSVYAREQAHCHFSPALIANLEKNWNAATRRA